MEKGLHIPTQNERIICFLQDNDRITSKDAMEKLGIYRLASRISDLEKLGYIFNREMVTCSNRFGEKTKFKAYSLEKEG